jgi:hypothetical protein
MITQKCLTRTSFLSTFEEQTSIRKIHIFLLTSTTREGNDDTGDEECQNAFKRLKNRKTAFWSEQRAKR